MIDTEEKNKETWIEVIKGINWTNIVLCIAGFFIGRIALFDSFYTLAIAYVGAMYHDKRTMGFTGVLTLLGIISSGPISESRIKYVLILILLMGFRFCMKMLKSSFNITNQGVITGFSIFIISIMNLFIGTPTLFGGIVCILDVLVGIGLVNLLSYGINIVYKQRTTPLSEPEMASMAFLIACAIGGMIDFYLIVPAFGNIYFKDVIGFMVIISVVYLGGMSAGIIMSLVIGSVLYILGYMPTQFIVIYLLAALIGGIFSFLERIGVIFSMGLGILLGFALFNNKELEWTILGAYTIAGLLSLCIPKGYFGIREWFGYESDLDEEKHLIHVQRIITERLKYFSNAYFELSKTFERISDKEIHFDHSAYNHIIEDTGENMCTNCSMRHFCWEDYIKDTYQNGYRMINTIEKKGQITTRDIPEEFKKACVNSESFAYTLSYKLDLLKQKQIWKKRIVEIRGLIGEQFSAVAHSIEKLYLDIENEIYFNKEDEHSIRQGLYLRGIRPKDIMVLENNGRKEEIHIYVHYKGEIDIKEKVVEVVQGVLDTGIETLKYEYNIEENYCYLKLGIKKQFKVLSGTAVAAKKDISGDVHSCMELNDGHYLLALADGMGSGMAAKEESTATIELLENFMDSGFKNDVAVKMINSTLVLKSDIENFSTMDIVLIDEYTGIAEFLKLGASTSFILRDNEITTVKASSLPIGILEYVDIVSCKKQLKDGDLVIMVTDGVLESKDDIMTKEETFKHFIKEAKTTTPQYLADYLLERSQTLLAGKESDDMTVIVARIWR